MLLQAFKQMECVVLLQGLSRALTCPDVLRFIIEIWVSPPSAVYTAKIVSPSGCQATSSGHLCFEEKQFVVLSKEMDGLQVQIF